VAVVDEDGVFVGLIAPPALIGIFLHEHDEDMARLGGYLRGTSAAPSASEEPILRRFWHKVPWLVLGLLGALISADVVGAFEGRLQENVLLAFFMPGIVYLADAVGTQTETVVVRGLSVGIGSGDSPCANSSRESSWALPLRRRSFQSFYGDGATAKWRWRFPFRSWWRVPSPPPSQ